MSSTNSSSLDKDKKALASQRMRQKILNTTIEILGTEGYPALTASKLSQKAGISKGALYHHFESLDDVRHCTLVFLLDMLMEGANPSLADDLETYLLTTGDGLITQIQEQPVAMKALYAYIFQALVDNSLRQKIMSLVEHSLDQYTQAIAHFCPTLSPSKLEQIVLVIDAYFGGAVMHWFMLKDEKRWRKSWKTFSDMLLDKLAKEV